MVIIRNFFGWLIFVPLLFWTAPLYAQLKSTPPSDSTYILSYDTMLTARIFLSQKYLSLHINDKGDAPILKFYPNSKLNLGIGASYGWFTFNVSAGVNFLNNS